VDLYLDRRTFIRDMGKGVIGIAVGGLALVACGDAETGSDSTASTDAAPTTGATTTPATQPSPATTRTSTSTTAAAATGALTFERVALGNVSAYLLVRGTEAAIVDTGNPGSAGDIEAALSSVGLGWADVGHVIVTHRHGDHVGSLNAVAEAATDAILGTGAGDIDSITAPRPLEAYEDGASVFGLQVVTTPGHTPGHIAVWDAATSVLVAGDAINGSGSGVAAMVDGVGGPNPQFSPDMAGAIDSVSKMAALQPDTILFGHGDPKLGGAAAALSALADQL
jgi:glyoxylase-like metal-dependent hydrolase (beta-lactamase superfamily II)